LDCLSGYSSRVATTSSIRVAAAILEVIQGPCQENQYHNAMKTEFLETLIES
jgi:hypothetical protein